MHRLARLVVVAALVGAALVVVGGGQVASGQTGPTGYTVGFDLAPNGRFDCGFYSVELSTGEATRVTPPSEFVDCADGLTFSPDGTLYAYANPGMNGVAAANLVTIDVATGDQTIIGELPTVFVGSGGMTFDVAGNLWLYAETPGDDDCTTFDTCLWQVDPSTADATFVGAGEVGEGVFGLAANCAGEVLAITQPNSLGPAPPPTSEVELQLVDTATAGLTSVVDTPDVFNPSGLDYDASEQLWALSQEPFVGFPLQRVQLIDRATGEVTTTPVTIGGDPFRGLLDGLAISPVSCPVPPPAPAPEVVLAPTFTG